MRTRRASFVTIAVVVIAAIVGGIGGQQLRRYQFRAGKTATPKQRKLLFDLLQPTAVTNCDLQRFGEPHDGGYLMCGNLFEEAQSAYSYGISGYDKWGCDMASTLNVTVHQYDCFDTRQPSCATGKTVFHAECVANRTKTEDGRLFDTIPNQLAKNGDTAKRIVLKIDVEGAEWESLRSAHDEVLERIDQLAVEFHWIQDETSLAVVRRLRQFFEVAHIHYNNASCIGGMEPFPTWAYEVLFVSKRLAKVDPTRRVMIPHPLDAPNVAAFAECRPDTR